MKAIMFFLVVLTSVFAQSRPIVTVPFVGCASDGQGGPLAVPKGRAKAVPVSAEAAQKLAWYKGESGFGVLAPRGWFCFGVYGSGGDALLLSPAPIGTERFFRDFKGFSGPGIVLARRYGTTSGRFDVAEVISRVFPAHIDFVRGVSESGFEEIVSDMKRGPWPGDRLTYRSDKIVEYRTPPQTDGLGTKSWLRKNDRPISGVAILVAPDTDLLQLSMRLPPELESLAPMIVRQVELEVKP